MQIKITRPTICNGKPVEPGDIVETSSAVGRQLIAIGKATDAPQDPAPANIETKKAPAPRRKK